MKIKLVYDTVGKSEKKAINKVLDSGFYSMGKVTKAFEREFAKYFNVKHAIMVNSGSSANLLAFSAIFDNDVYNTEKLPRKLLKKGDEVIVPAVSWSTSIWPIAQVGAVPVFVDNEPFTMQTSVDAIKKAITKKTKAICVVHVLGNAGYINEIKKLCDKHKLWLIEDTCESLGVKNNNKFLGTFGEIGTFSFFFSHHITTVEGGMVITNNDYLADKIRSLRAHGWARDMDSREKYYEMFPDIDPRFLFLTIGYNLRPTDINASVGRVQLKKLKKHNEHRNKIGKEWNKDFAHLKKNELMIPMEITKKTVAAWFGFPVLCKTKEIRDKFRVYLEKNGIETRPIICGNMLRQPAIKNIKHRVSGKITGANEIMDRGIFWGNSPDMKKSEIKYVSKIVNNFFSKYQ